MACTVILGIKYFYSYIKRFYEFILSGFLPAALCDEWLISPMTKIIGAEEDEICLMNGLRTVFYQIRACYKVDPLKGARENL